MFVLNSCVCLTPDEARFIRDALDNGADLSEEVGGGNETVSEYVDKCRKLAVEIDNLVYIEHG